MLKCTLRSGSGRNRSEEIPEYDDVLAEINSTLRAGDTLGPVIFMPDGTHLSNFDDTHKGWPVSMTIGNLSSRLRQMPSIHRVVIVALLPIPIKNHNVPHNRLDELQETNQVVLNKVLRRVFQPLTIEHNPNTESGYYNVFCGDGNFRRCNLVLAA
jgi:hypothetical protein